MMIHDSTEQCGFGLLEHGVNRLRSSQTGAQWHIGYCSFDGIAGKRYTAILEWIQSEPFHDAVKGKLD
jgi:hypothetical protein